MQLAKRRDLRLTVRLSKGLATFRISLSIVSERDRFI